MEADSELENRFAELSLWFSPDVNNPRYVNEDMCTVYSVIPLTAAAASDSSSLDPHQTC